MFKKYLLNPLSVLFHPQLDQKNKSNTIVYDPLSEEIIKIDRFGYTILKAIDENPGIDSETISRLTLSGTQRVERFLEIMKEKNVVFQK